MLKLIKIMKWLSIPAILVASLFARYAADYELAVNLVACLCAAACVWRTVQSNEYSWATGFVAIAVVFSPLVLVDKIFLLMGLACTASLITSIGSFRTQPLPAEFGPEIV